jgi:hypothetical protein
MDTTKPPARNAALEELLNLANELVAAGKDRNTIFVEIMAANQRAAQCIRLTEYYEFYEKLGRHYPQLPLDQCANKGIDNLFLRARPWFPHEQTNRLNPLPSRVNEEDLFKSPDVFALSLPVLAPKQEIGTGTMRGRTSDNHFIRGAGGQLL